MSKDMRNARAKLVDQARALINNRKATPEALARADVMLTEAEGMKAKIDRSERTESLFATLAPS